MWNGKDFDIHKNFTSNRANNLLTHKTAANQEVAEVVKEITKTNIVPPSFEHKENSEDKNIKQFVSSLNKKLMLEYRLNYQDDIPGTMTEAMMNLFMVSGNIPMGKAFIDVNMAIQQSTSPIIDGYMHNEKIPASQEKIDHIVSAMYNIANAFSIEKGTARSDEYREIYTILISELWSNGANMKFFKRLSELLTQYDLEPTQKVAYHFEETVQLDY